MKTTDQELLSDVIVGGFALLVGVFISSVIVGAPPRYNTVPGHLVFWGLFAGTLVISSVLSYVLLLLTLGRAIRWVFALGHDVKETINRFAPKIRWRYNRLDRLCKVIGRVLGTIGGVMVMLGQITTSLDSSSAAEAIPEILLSPLLGIVAGVFIGAVSRIIIYIMLWPTASLWILFLRRR